MAVRSRVVDRAAGVLLLAGAFANFAGVIMFSIRGGPSEMAEPTRASPLELPKILQAAESEG